MPYRRGSRLFLTTDIKFGNVLSKREREAVLDSQKRRIATSQKKSLQRQEAGNFKVFQSLAESMLGPNVKTHVVNVVEDKKSAKVDKESKSARKIKEKNAEAFALKKNGKGSDNFKEIRGDESSFHFKHNDESDFAPLRHMQQRSSCF